MWKGKKRKQEEEEQTNVYIRKHVEKPKEQSSPQVLQLQSKTKREGKNKKLKLGVDPVKLIHQEDKPKGKKRKQTSEEGNKREGKKRKQTTIQIGKHVEKPKEHSSPQVLQLQSKTKREGKNKKLKLEHVERPLIQQAEEHANFYIGKYVGKPEPTSGEGNKRSEEQTNFYIVDKPKPKGKKRKQTSEEQTIQIGDVVNLSDLLFTNTRDYLIKYKDNQVVKDEQLAGKVVVLLFVSLTIGHKHWKTRLPDLFDLYHKLEPKGGFEVVFVAFEDGISCYDTLLSKYSTPHGRFEECFSTMPWTAIPFSDVESRKRLETKFGVFSHTQFDIEPTILVIDPRGIVVQSDAIHMFLSYGAAAFPFTNERLECLDAEDNVAGMQLSIKALLASPERDYVITNKGEQVPLHKLEDKVVGLLFYTQFWRECIPWKLKMVYEELSKTGKDFEVVLINVLPISSVTFEDALWKIFETMPWLAIPFKDTYTSKKLMRIFDHILCDPGPDPVSKLVIIGPHGKFIEPLGARVMMRYGIPAYPFTCSSAVKLKIKSIKDVKPEMLWNLDSVFRQENGSRVQFSQIVGKRIIVLYKCYQERTPTKHSEHSLNKLKALYIQMKGTDDEFEVIQIHGARGVGRVAAGVPWLTHPPFDKASDAGQVLTHIFSCSCRGLFAFDRDGTIVRMTPYPATIGNTVFPFYEFEDGMEDEVLQLVKNDLGPPLEFLSNDFDEFCNFVISNDSKPSSLV